MNCGSPLDPNVAFGAAGLFQEWRDPESGIRSWILTHRVAPVQQAPYFTQDLTSPGGEGFWFYCAFPPGGSSDAGRTLGYCDLAGRTVAHYPETQFSACSPMLDTRSGQVYWASGPRIHRRPADPAGVVETVFEMPATFLRNRRLFHLSTHLTASPDGTKLCVDARLLRSTCLGTADIATGAFDPWCMVPGHGNHAQFNPVDPDSILFAQDWWHDPESGEWFPIQIRSWTVRRGQSPQPVLRDVPVGTQRNHEWWDPDGRHVWYCDYVHGVERADAQTGERERVWSTAVTHAHADRSGQYLVADVNPYRWREQGCRVLFHNRRADRTVAIVTRLPEPPVSRSLYHIDPHPHFCFGGACIAYTTTVLGRVDVAFASVAELVAATGG